MEILLCHCACLLLKVWLVVECAAMASLLFLCGPQWKRSLLGAPCRPVSLPEVYLLSKHHLQEGPAGASPQAPPMVEPTYPGEPPPGQAGLQWAGDSLWPLHQPGVSYRSRPGGECLNWKPHRSYTSIYFEVLIRHFIFVLLLSNDRCVNM